MCYLKRFRIASVINKMVHSLEDDYKNRHPDNKRSTDNTKQVYHPSFHDETHIIHTVLLLFRDIIVLAERRIKKDFVDLSDPQDHQDTKFLILKTASINPFGETLPKIKVLKHTQAHRQAHTHTHTYIQRHTHTDSHTALMIAYNNMGEYCH